MTTGENRVRSSNAGFSTTQWSLVLAAGVDGDSHARDALAVLCERYWYPIYAHLRRMRFDPDTAQDLTQGFFTHLVEKEALRVGAPERGRFRAFLKGSLKNYLSNERHRETAPKRGGGKPLLSLELGDAETRFRYEPSHDDTPEVRLERAWARTVLARVLEHLRNEIESMPGARERFARLEPILTGNASGQPYRDVANELKTSEAAIKVAVHRLRNRFGELLRLEIAETVNDPGEVDDEIRYLLDVIRSGGPDA